MWDWVGKWGCFVRPGCRRLWSSSDLGLSFVVSVFFCRPWWLRATSLLLLLLLSVPPLSVSCGLWPACRVCVAALRAAAVPCLCRDPAPGQAFASRLLPYRFLPLLSRPVLACRPFRCRLLFSFPFSPDGSALAPTCRLPSSWLFLVGRSSRLCLTPIAFGSCLLARRHPQSRPPRGDLRAPASARSLPEAPASPSRHPAPCGHPRCGSLPSRATRGGVGHYRSPGRVSRVVSACIIWRLGIPSTPTSSGYSVVVCPQVGLDLSTGCPHVDHQKG